MNFYFYTITVHSWYSRIFPPPRVWLDLKCGESLRLRVTRMADNNILPRYGCCCYVVYMTYGRAMGVIVVYGEFHDVGLCYTWKMPFLLACSSASCLVCCCSGLLAVMLLRASSMMVSVRGLPIVDVFRFDLPVFLQYYRLCICEPLWYKNKNSSSLRLKNLLSLLQ